MTWDFLGSEHGLNENTRRSVLAGAGALLSGAVGCTQYPEGQHTLPPKNTENGEKETQAPQGTQDGSTPEEGNGGVLQLEPLRFEEMIEITPYAEALGETKETSSAVLSNPSGIAPKIPAQLYKDEKEANLNLFKQHAELFDYKNISNRMAVVGRPISHNAFRAGFNPETVKSNLQEDGYSQAGEYGGFNLLNLDDDSILSNFAVAYNNQMMIVSKADNPTASNSPIKKAIDAYNGDLETYSDLNFIQDLPEMEGERQEIYRNSDGDEIDDIEAKILVEDHKIQTGNDYAKVDQYILRPDGSTTQKTEKEHISLIFGNRQK
jgi:hypothetical protein